MGFCVCGVTAPHLTGFGLKLFVKIIETPLLGSLIMSFLKKQNKAVEVSNVNFFFLKQDCLLY